MSSKVPLKTYFFIRNQSMFQTCVLDQNVQAMTNTLHFLKLFLNVMIKNIKIQNIFDIIKVSKSIQAIKYIH
jgi:hypothetical protein